MDRIWNASVHCSLQREVEYWLSKNITHFTMQWGDWEVPGMTERIELVGALGVTTNFSIKSLQSRVGLATTIIMFWTPVCDFWVVDAGTTAISGMSLVHGTTNFYENFNISMEQVMIVDGDFPYPFTPTDQVLRDAIGPFGSIDMKHILFPDSLFEFVMNATALINDKLLSHSEAQDQFGQIPENVLLPLFPASWRTPNESVWGNLSGNPLCSVGTKVSYVQRFLSPSDTCSLGAFQEQVRETRLKLVLSLLAIGNYGVDKWEAICSTGLLFTNECIGSIQLTSQFINSTLLEWDRAYVQSLAQTAHQDVILVNPELIQFVVNNSNSSQYELLHHPLLESKIGDLWYFFGWMLAIDWVTGGREVIRFEGDAGTLTLLSAQLSSSILEVRGNEIPHSLSVYFLRIVQYSTIVSIACASLALFYASTCRGQVAGFNLLEFNRVTSAVWIGRPLVLARGIVAVGMISSSRVFFNRHDQMTTFDETPKAWYNVILTASESFWFSYVTVDLFVAITQGYTLIYASLSSMLVQFLNAVIDFVMPFEHTVEINQQCEVVVFQKEISCFSGRVEIGSLTRLLTIAAVAIGTTLLTCGSQLLQCLSFMVAKCCFRGSPKKCLLVMAGYIKDDGIWYLDKASALLMGLVTFRFGRYARVLDVKTWSLLHLHDNQMYDLEPSDATKSRANDRVDDRTRNCRKS